MQKNLSSKLRWSIVSNIFNLISGIIIIILISRGLGTITYGDYETLIALAAVLVLFADYGISASTSRYIAENKSEKELVNDFINTSFILKISLFIFIFILVSIYYRDISEIMGIKLVNSGLILTVLFLARTGYEYLSRILQGLDEIIYASKMNIVKTTCQMVILTLLYLVNYFGLISVLLVEVLAFSLIIILMLLKIKRMHYTFNFKNFRMKTALTILKYSFPLFIISLGFLVYTQTDVLMIQYYMSSYEVGIYAIVIVIITKLQAPFTALGFTFAPLFSGNLNPEKTSMYNKVLIRVIILAMPISFGIYSVADQLINVIFGPDYSESINILKVLVIYTFFLSLNTVFTPIMDFMGNATLRSWFMISTALLKVVLSIILIPDLGLYGLVIATITSYLLYSLAVNIYLFRVFNKENDFKGNLIIAKDITIIVGVNLLMLLMIEISQMIVGLEAVELMVSICIGIITYLAIIKIIFNLEIKNILSF